MLFFFGELDSTRLIQGDTAAGDERITLLDVCAGRCTMPIPLAHSRSAQEERQMEFGRWAKQVWLGRRKGSVTLAASWQRATFSPPKCNVAMRLALASVGVTLIDGGSRGGGAVVRSVLKRNHRRYQRAMRPRRATGQRVRSTSSRSAPAWSAVVHCAGRIGSHSRWRKPSSAAAVCSSDRAPCRRRGGARGGGGHLPARGS